MTRPRLTAAQKKALVWEKWQATYWLFTTSGYRCGPLAVQRGRVSWDGKNGHGKGFQVVHVASGYTATRMILPTLPAAKAAVEDLLRLRGVDWAVPASAVGNERLERRVVRALRKHGGRCRGGDRRDRLRQRRDL